MAHGIELSDECHDIPTIQDIQALAVDITLLYNNLLSYYKEESEDVPHNILAASCGLMIACARLAEPDPSLLAQS